MSYLKLYIFLTIFCVNHIANAVTEVAGANYVDFSRQDLVMQVHFKKEGLKNLRQEFDEDDEFHLRVELHVGPYSEAGPYYTEIPLGKLASDDIFPIWKKEILLERTMLKALTDPTFVGYFGPQETPSIDVTLKMFLVPEKGIINWLLNL